MGVAVWCWRLDNQGTVEVTVHLFAAAIVGSPDWVVMSRRLLRDALEVTGGRSRGHVEQVRRLTAEDLLLDAPSGVWPDVIYRRTGEDAEVFVAVEGLDRWGESGAEMSFLIDVRGCDPSHIPGSLPVVVEVDLRSAHTPVVAWTGRAHFEVRVITDDASRRPDLSSDAVIGTDDADLALDPDRFTSNPPHAERAIVGDRRRSSCVPPGRHAVLGRAAAGPPRAAAWHLRGPVSAGLHRAACRENSDAAHVLGWGAGA